MKSTSFQTNDKFHEELPGGGSSPSRACPDFCFLSRQGKGEQREDKALGEKTTGRGNIKTTLEKNDKRSREHKVQK